MRILIVKLSAIGDIVHTLPALAVIRQGLPEAEIDWAVETSAAEILRGNPLIANLIEINTKDLRQRKTARGILAGKGCFRGHKSRFSPFRRAFAACSGDDLCGCARTGKAGLSAAARRISTTGIPSARYAVLRSGNTANPDNTRDSGHS